jgi:hypothetical protein
MRRQAVRFSTEPGAGRLARDVHYAAHWVVRKGYPMAAKPSDQAIVVRDLAKRARRLASTLIAAEDVDRLLRYADELEAQAADLDRRAKEDD